MADDILYRVHESEHVPAPAAEAAPTFEDLPPAIAGIVDGVIEEIIAERGARRRAIEKLRGEVNTLSAKLDVVIGLLSASGKHAKEGTDVISLPAWPVPKRDAS